MADKEIENLWVADKLKTRLKKIKDFEVGEIYTPFKEQRRSSPGHWHNSYFIPLKKIEGVGPARYEMIVVNAVTGGKAGQDTAAWSGSVRNSIFQVQLPQEVSGKIFKYIFKEKLQ